VSNRKKSPVEIDTVSPHLCTIDLRLEILGQLPFLAGLSGKELEGVNQHFRERGFDTGETIYFSDEKATHLYVVASGQVRLLQHSRAGKDVLLDLLVPGEFFGTLNPGPQERYQETAEAQVATCVLTIGADEFRELMGSYPQIALAVLDITAGRLQLAQDRVRQLSAQPVEQRIAAVLLRLADKLGESHEEGILIQTPLSREDLAQLTGTTPETASRIMSHLQKEGLLSSGRQWVAIKKRQQLARLATGEG
jgi:CRP-like cAMP-binding protein